MSFIIFSYFFAITLVALGVIIFGRVLPEVIKEGNVHNGLRDYRKIFLVSKTTFFLLGISVLLIMCSRFVIPLDVYRTFSVVLLDLFAFMYLVIAIASERIYNYKFTNENKKIHALIEDLEQGRVKIVRLRK